MNISISILGVLVVVLLCVKIHSSNSFKSVQLLFAAAFVHTPTTCSQLETASSIGRNGCHKKLP